MSIDLSAIQSIGGFDLASSLSNGLALRQARDEAQRGNALRGFMARHGAGLIAGDRNALAGYAALDPAGAMGLQNDLLAQEASRQSMTLAEAQDRRAAEAHALGLQSDRQAMGYRSAAEGRAVEQHALGMDMDRQAMGLQAEQARRVAEDYARGRAAEDLAAEAAELEADLRGAAYYHRAGDREGFEAHLAQAGVAPGTVTFDGFPAMAARMEGVLSTWTALGPPEAEVREVDGRLYRVTPEGASLVPGVAEPERPRPMTPEERAAWNLPADAPYGMGRDGMPKPLSGGGVTVNTGEQETAFAKAAGSKLAETAVATMDQGAAAQRSLGQIDTLAGMLAQAPQGARGAWVARAAALGLPVEGADDVQAAQALISQLVPQQRPPGSGQMSDADLALFKESLPAIIRQPGGNQLILDTMRAVAEYDLARGRIAERLLVGEMSQAQANEAYRALGNPIPERLRQSGTGTGGTAETSEQAAAPAVDVPPVPGHLSSLYTPEEWAAEFSRLSPEEQELFRD